MNLKLRFDIRKTCYCGFDLHKLCKLDLNPKALYCEISICLLFLLVTFKLENALWAAGLLGDGVELNGLI